MKTNLNVDTQGLREKILDLAMRGKLVEQDPNDNSAKLNLKRARKEIETANSTKKLRQNKYIEAKKPTFFPKEWEAARLTEICMKEDAAIKRGPFGSAIKKSMFVPKSTDTFKVYEQGNAIQKSIDYGNYFMPDSEFERLSAFEVKPGDIIISCAGTIGKYYVLPPNSPRGIINQALMKLTIDESIMLKDFFLLAFDHITDQLIASARGSAMKNLSSVKYLKNEVLFPLPPLAEQRRIADKVSELFSQLDVIEKNVAEYQDLEQAMRSKLLDLAMRGKLVEQDPNDEPASELLKKIQSEKAKLVKEGKINKSKKLPEITDDEKPFVIPDSWEWVRLGDVSKLITKGTTPRGGRSAYVSKGINFFRAENIHNEIVDNNNIQFIPEELHTSTLGRSILKEKDILITIAGSLGRVGVVKKENLPGNVNQAISICRLVNHKLIDVDYLVSAIVFGAKLLRKNKKATSIPNLTLKQISELSIPLPPLEEQKRIVAKLEEIFEQLNIINNNLVSAS